MDQQFDEYKEGLQGFWEKAKKFKFSGVSIKHSRLLVLIVIIGLIQNGSAIYNELIYLPYIQIEEIELILFIGLKLVSPVIYVAGVIPFLRLKTMGMVLILTWIFNQIWICASSLWYAYFSGAGNDELYLSLEGLFYVDTTSLFIKLILSVVVLRYLLLNPIKDLYKLTKKHIVFAIVLGPVLNHFLMWLFNL